MSKPSRVDSQQRVLDAALNLFARYGFQRATMAELAKAAGVSRAALYLRFSGKEAVFQALARRLVADTLAQAGAAWLDTRGFEENLVAAVLAKDLPLYRLLKASPHGAELLAVDAELTARFAAELDHGFTALLMDRTAAAAAAGALDVAALGGPADFAAIIAIATAALKHEARDEAAYVASVRRLCRVFARAAHPR